MRRGIQGLLGLAIGVGCMAQEATPPSTGELLGPEGARAHAWIALRDVHPLWGGREVFVEGSGQVVVREVPRGGPPDEQRAAGEIPAAEAQALLARAVELDLLRVKIPERPGVPDEARPTLVLHAASGAEGRLTKWENDRVPALDELRGRLNEIAERVLKAHPPQAVGRFDPAWRPFAALELTVDCLSGRPNPRCDLSRPEDWAELAKRLQDLPAAAPAPEPDRLGMRGFLLLARGAAPTKVLPGPVRVHAGRVWIGSGAAQEVRQDAHGLEAWLTEKAQAAGLTVPR